MIKKTKLPELHIVIKNGSIFVTMNGIGKEYDYAEFIKENYKNPYADFVKVEKAIDAHVRRSDRKRLKKATETQELDIPILHAIIDFMQSVKSEELTQNTGKYINAYARECGVRGVRPYGARVSLQYVLSKRDFVFEYNFKRSRYILDDKRKAEKAEIVTEHEMYYADKLSLWQRLKLLYAKNSIRLKYWIKNKKHKIKQDFRAQEQRTNKEDKENNNSLKEEQNDINYKGTEKTIEYHVVTPTLYKKAKLAYALEQNENQEREIHFIYNNTQADRDKIKNGIAYILEYAKENKEELRKDSKKIYRDISNGKLTECMDILIGENGVIRNGEAVFASSPKQFYKALSKENIDENMSEHDKEIVYYVFLQKLLIERIKKKKDLPENVLKENEPPGVVRLNKEEVEVLEH